MKEIIICTECAGKGSNRDRFTQTDVPCEKCKGKRVLVKTTVITVSSLDDDN